ncbi:hypothetical protein GGI06_002595, partial [Coemansia sp. S85]
ESVPTWEAAASSAEMSNGQSHSSPSTPTETLGFGQSQYTLHAVDHQPVYSVASSNGLPGAEPSMSSAAPSSSAPVQASAISALNMVNPISNSSMAAPMANSGDRTAKQNDGADSGNGAEPDFSSMAAAVAAAAAAASNNGSVSARAEVGSLPNTSAANGYLYGYPGTSTSPSLNSVASNLFSMRQIGSQPNMSEPNAETAESTNGHAQADRLAAVAAAAAATASTTSSVVPGVGGKSFADSQHLNEAHGFVAGSEQPQQQGGTDAHHLRRNMVQSPSFNVNVLSENVQFQNYS